MEKEIIIPQEYNAAFLNVTLSIQPDINGRYALSDLMGCTKGDWWINPGIASKIKYVFPVKRNEILGVFEVVGFEEIEIENKTRVRFKLKMIYEGSHQMKINAAPEVNKTNYVVKLIQVDPPTKAQQLTKIHKK
jgi:hypothetical protein